MVFPTDGASCIPEVWKAAIEKPSRSVQPTTGFPSGVTTSSRYASPVTVVVTILEIAVLGAVNLYVVPLGNVGELLNVVML